MQKVLPMDNPDILSTLKTFFDYWQNTILASGVFLAIFVAAWTVWSDRKNLKLNGLNLVFQKLNNQEKRESRGKILSAYYDYLVDNNLSLEYTVDDFQEKHPKVDLAEIHPDLREDIETIKSDFDEIAVMTKHGLVNKEGYFDASHGSMLRCYAALHGNIEKSRVKTGSTEHYNSAFLDLCIEAIEYWKKHHEVETIKYHGQERNDFTLQRYEYSGWKIRIQNPKSRIMKCRVYCDKEPLKSENYGDDLEHTVEEGGGYTLIMTKTPDQSMIITIKSEGHIIKRIKFLEIERSKP